MSKAFRNIKLFIVFFTQFHTEPLAIGPAARAQVNSHVKFRSLDYTYQLALGILLLEMQATQHTFCTHRLIILDKSHVQASFVHIILIICLYKIARLSPCTVGQSHTVHQWGLRHFNLSHISPFSLQFCLFQIPADGILPSRKWSKTVFNQLFLVQTTVKWSCRFAQAIFFRQLQELPLSLSHSAYKIRNKSHTSYISNFASSLFAQFCICRMVVAVFIRLAHIDQKSCQIIGISQYGDQVIDYPHLFMDLSCFDVTFVSRYSEKMSENNQYEGDNFNIIYPDFSLSFHLFHTVFRTSHISTLIPLSDYYIFRILISSNFFSANPISFCITAAKRTVPSSTITTVKMYCIHPFPIIRFRLSFSTTRKITM